VWPNRPGIASIRVYGRDELLGILIGRRVHVLQEIL
jgi:hypothetical protein